MNIDDRLDRLEIVVERIAERHEGLSQSVELLVATHDAELGMAARASGFRVAGA